MSNQPLAKAVATFGGLGDRLPAPGTTVGSLPPALLWLGICVAIPTIQARIAVTAIGLVVFSVVGIWSSEIEAERRKEGDPRPIVIDEAAGQWLTYLVALPFLPLLTTVQLAIFAGAGFLLFRFFDVVKVWPIKAFEKLPGGIGIVADELLRRRLPRDRVACPRLRTFNKNVAAHSYDSPPRHQEHQVFPLFSEAGVGGALHREQSTVTPSAESEKHHYYSWWIFW
jgi:phosphatidylglycerophosphatase A